MNIWIVNQYAIPPEQAGPTRHYSLAREMVKRGHQVTIIASSFDHVTRRETRLRPGEDWRLELVGGVFFLWLRTPPYRGNSIARVWNMLVFSYRVVKLLASVDLTRPSVIIGSSPHLLAALATQRVAQKIRVPFVLEVRDLWPQSLVDLGEMSPRHPLVFALSLVEKHLYRSADRIVSLLPGAVEYMVEKGAVPGKIVWLPNGVDWELVPSPTPPDPAGVFTVVYAGAHGLANALDSILDAAARLESEGWADKVQICLVGDGPQKARLQERARTEALAIVKFEPTLPKHLVFNRLAMADAFIITLRDTPLFRFGISPNKLYDYMSCGRPIICAINTPHNPVRQADAGIVVPPEDAGAIADAIKQLCHMEVDERHEMGMRARRYAQENHAMDELGRRFEAIIAAVARDS